MTWYDEQKGVSPGQLSFLVLLRVPERISQLTHEDLLVMKLWLLYLLFRSRHMQ